MNRNVPGQLLDSAQNGASWEDLVRRQEHEIRVLRQELLTQTALANIGELARPVTHEFNNFLNVLLLHMAVLEMELPPKLRQEVAEIQRQGKAITAVVRQFQRYRQQQQTSSEPVDLNQTVREAVAALGAGPEALEGASDVTIRATPKAEGVDLHLRLAPELPALLGFAADFRRLCHFLLANAAAVTGPNGGSITLSTETAPGKVLLRVEDGGPPVPADILPHLFDVNVTAREGTSSLELASCKTLVHRLRGSIECANRPEGGLAFVIEFAVQPG